MSSEVVDPEDMLGEEFMADQRLEPSWTGAPVRGVVVDPDEVRGLLDSSPPDPSSVGGVPSGLSCLLVLHTPQEVSTYKG